MAVRMGKRTGRPQRGRGPSKKARVAGGRCQGWAGPGRCSAQGPSAGAGQGEQRKEEARSGTRSVSEGMRGHQARMETHQPP